MVRIKSKAKALLGSVLLAFLLTCVAAGPAAAEPITLGALMARVMEARGGYAALREVRTLVFEGIVTQPGNDKMQLSTTVRARRDGWVRVDIMNGNQRLYSAGVDGEGEWEWEESGLLKGVTDPEKTSSARYGVDLLFGLNSPSKRGYKLSLEPGQKVRGVKYHVIKQRFNNGFERFLFVNPRTWRIDFDRKAKVLRPGTPDDDKVDEVYSDFRAVGDLTWPFRDELVNFVTGEVSDRVEFTKITYNTELTDAVMDRDP